MLPTSWRSFTRKLMRATDTRWLLRALLITLKLKWKGSSASNRTISLPSRNFYRLSKIWRWLSKEWEHTFQEIVKASSKIVCTGLSKLIIPFNRSLMSSLPSKLSRSSVFSNRIMWPLLTIWWESMLLSWSWQVSVSSWPGVRSTLYRRNICSSRERRESIIANLKGRWQPQDSEDTQSGKKIGRI